MMRLGRESSVVVALLTICAAWPKVLSCPMAECDCQTGIRTVINCKGKGLTEIPTIVPSTQPYDEITLADNSVSHIPASAFEGLVVKKIDIQGNPVNNISEAGFNGVESTLETLILHGDKNNRVLPAPWRALTNLSALAHLQLSYFDIGNIDDRSALATLTNLQTLEITDSQLHSLHRDVLQPLRQSLSTLDLSNNVFLTIPTEAIRGLGTLKKLILQSNSISKIEANSFATNNQLEELEFAQNQISVLEYGCFNQITNSLNFLGMNLNKLTGGQLVAIENMTALHQVNIGYNPLVSIPPRIFRNLQQLEFLYLRSCQLERLTIDMFEGLGPAMVRLTLSENHFQHMETGVFARMTVLSQLEFDNQNINLTTSLVPGVFTGLNQLQSIDLENTGFGSTDNWEAIRSLKSLTTLTLSNNQIKQIPDFIFTNMTRLQTLKLPENMLTNISQATFHGLRETLTTLDLHSNQLSTFDHCTFLDFSMLKPAGVILNSNPLACDCGLGWLGEWVQNNTTSFEKSLIPWTCSDGRRFVNLRPEDFGCADNTTRPQCANYYATTTQPPTAPQPETTETVSTTTTRPTTTTTRPNLILLFNITGVSDSTISLSWEINHPSYVDYYMIEYEDLSTSERKNTGVIYRTTTDYTVENLQSRRSYEVCIFVYYKTSDPKNENKCLARSTSEPTTTPTIASALNSEEIGIIAGSVAGGFLLLIIVAVIVFILVRHRQQGNVYNQPREPIPWQRAGKPHEAYDSKRFTKQKKPGNDHHIKEIRHVQGNNNLQRTSAGSYQYLDRDVHQLPSPGGHMHLTHSFEPQSPQANGLDTSDLRHKYYEIALDGIESHI